MHILLIWYLVVSIIALYQAAGTAAVQVLLILLYGISRVC